MRILFILIFLLLTSCTKEPLYQSQGYIFGTLVDIKIYGETESRANILSDKILQDFQSLHNRLHAWKPISANKLSEIGEINAQFARGNKPISISPDLSSMLADITKLSVKSNGLFDPAISQLIGVWGFQRDDFSPVDIDAEKIKSLVKANPRMTDIVLKGNSAYSNNPSVKLDLGGYAKGYALDIAAAYLREQHVKGALINVGGNIIAIGQHGDKPWRVGIQHPRASTAIATLDLLDGWAIGTSGDYQRYFMLGGKRYSHIIDPRTGYPTQHTQAVTVLVPPQAIGEIQAGVLSDVVSKPIFIEPPEKKGEAAQVFNIENYMVIDDKSHIFVSKEMAKKLNWITADVNFTVLTQASDTKTSIKSRIVEPVTP